MQIAYMWETIYGSKKNIIGAGIANQIGKTLKNSRKSIEFLTQYFS
jgi:hypothetical protein